MDGQRKLESFPSLREVADELEKPLIPDGPGENLDEELFSDTWGQDMMIINPLRAYLRYVSQAFAHFLMSSATSLQSLFIRPSIV